MEALRSLFKIIGNNKARKSRTRSIKLALKTSADYGSIITVADKIDKYINQGL